MTRSTFDQLCDVVGPLVEPAPSAPGSHFLVKYQLFCNCLKYDLVLV